MSELFLGIALSTPTRACVIDAEGKVRGRGFSGRNIAWDHAGAVKSVAEVAEEAMAEAGSKLADAKMVCVSFVDPYGDGDYPWAYGFVKEALGDVPFVATDHVRAAHAAAYGEEDGIVLATGDESEALGVEKGTWARAGGWGDEIGGEGTMRRILYQGLNVALRFYDGRGDRTTMLDAFCTIVDRGPRLIEYRIHDKHVSYVDLCKVVFKCAEAGDLPAMRVLHREARELVTMAKAVVKRIEVPSPRISVIGWCFDFPVFLEVFRRCAHEELPQAAIEVCERATVDGAAIIAKANASHAGDTNSIEEPYIW